MRKRLLSRLTTTRVFILLFLKDFSISQTQNDIFVEGIGGSNVEH